MRTWALDQFYIWRLLSVVAALGLMQLPLPLGVSAWQPQWVLMVCLFWLWLHPTKLSILWIVFVGVMVDYVSGLPIGIHVMCFLVVIGLVLWKHYQLMHFNRLHQFFFSIVLFLCYFLMMRLGFAMCQLEWSWVMMLQTFVSTCVLWTLCIMRFNFHGFWFNYVD
jgi:rod shape-determining protein MreD